MCKILAEFKSAGNLKGKDRDVGFNYAKPLPSYHPGLQLRKSTRVFFHVPCLCITLKNLTMTFELGRMRT